MARSGWPDLVFSDEARRESLSRAVTAGRLRRIARGIYTSSADPLEAVTRRHLPEIVAHEFPGAVIVDRSARTGLAGTGEDLYVDHRRDRPLELPGVVIRPRPGPGPLPGDIPLSGGIHMSSPARGLIDNLAGRGRRFLSNDELDGWIADLRVEQGEERLDEMLDLASDIARQTDRMLTLERLSRLISGELPTWPAGAGKAAVQVMDPGPGRDAVAVMDPEASPVMDLGVGAVMDPHAVAVMDPHAVAVMDPDAGAGRVGVGVGVPVMDPGAGAEMDTVAVMDPEAIPVMDPGPGAVMDPGAGAGRVGVGVGVPVMDPGAGAETDTVAVMDPETGEVLVTVMDLGGDAVPVMDLDDDAETDTVAVMDPEAGEILVRVMDLGDDADAVMDLGDDADAVMDLGDDADAVAVMDPEAGEILVRVTDLGDDAIPVMDLGAGPGAVAVMDLDAGPDGVAVVEPDVVPVMDPGAGPAGARVSVRATEGPYDRERIATFEAAADFLAHELEPNPFPDPPESARRWLLLPFYEAHFSSCMEVRQFTLDQAAAIVFDKMVPMERPGDARELLGTYRIVSKPAEMSLVPGSATEFVELLRRRHYMIMDGRPGKLPGEFRRATADDNAAFVSPELVEGTLRAGFGVGQGLRDPFARAVFMMFLVSEVYPFTAGNGCLARIMMNAELVAAHEVRIAVPAVLRVEYLSAVKTASQQQSFESMSSVLDTARRWTSEVDFSSWVSAERDAVRTNALVDLMWSGKAKTRLILPSALEPVAG